MIDISQSQAEAAACGDVSVLKLLPAKDGQKCGNEGCPNKARYIALVVALGNGAPTCRECLPDLRNTLRMIETLGGVSTKFMKRILHG